MDIALVGILLRFPLRARAQRVANGAAASLACQEVPLCGSVERDSHSTLSAGRVLDWARKAVVQLDTHAPPSPGFCHMDSGSPGTKNEPAGVQSPTYSEAPKTSPQGLWLPAVLKNPISQL